MRALETYFDTPERNSEAELQKKIDQINMSPLMNLFLNSISGLLAIIDEHRQLISLNRTYLNMLHLDDPEAVLGLRQGEIINCIHSREKPWGCGTTRFCQSCGAAIAIASSLAGNRSIEQNCSIQILKGDAPSDLFLRVKCEPIVIEDTRFLLLFLHDITKEQQRLMLENSFFHDFKNIIAGLATANYQLSRGKYDDDIVTTIDTATRSLIKEVEVQCCLMNNDLDYYKKLSYAVSVENLMKDLSDIYHHHPVKKNKSLRFDGTSEPYEIMTDSVLLLRIISNMVTNAFEATEDGGEVSVSWIKKGESIVINVHNDSSIPQKYQMRIFQRNFSTKAETGRGIGTYSMKLFGEEILGGSVGFHSTIKNGTDFFISLPIQHL